MSRGNKDIEAQLASMSLKLVERDGRNIAGIDLADLERACAEERAGRPLRKRSSIESAPPRRKRSAVLVVEPVAEMRERLGVERHRIAAPDGRHWPETLGRGLSAAEVDRMYATGSPLVGSDEWPAWATATGIRPLPGSKYPRPSKCEGWWEVEPGTFSAHPEPWADGTIKSK